MFHEFKRRVLQLANKAWKARAFTQTAGIEQSRLKILSPVNPSFHTLCHHRFPGVLQWLSLLLGAELPADTCVPPVTHGCCQPSPFTCWRWSSPEVPNTWEAHAISHVSTPNYAGTQRGQPPANTIKCFRCNAQEAGGTVGRNHFSWIYSHLLI